MRENEFERKVQEQLDELRLRPSDEVWTKVEKEIREKKRKRVLIVFFLLAGLGLLGYSGYTLLNPGTDKQVAVQTQPATNNNTNTTTDNNNSSTGINKTPTENTLPTKENTAVAEKPGTSIEKEIPVDDIKSSDAVKKARETSEWIASLKKEILRKDQIATKKTRTTKPDKKNIVALSEEKDIVADNKGVAVTTIPPTVTSVDTTVAAIKAPDTAIAKNDIQVNEDSVKTEAINIAKNKKTVSPKIRFGVEFAEGITSSRQRLIGIDLGGMQSLNDITGNIYANPGTNAGPAGGRGIQPPSDVRSRSGWRLGVVAEKKVNNRISATGGLRYTYLSEKIKVGVVRDTFLLSNSYGFAQNFQINRGWSFYSSQSQISYQVPYINKYHFFEMPLQFQYQLNKSKKTGIVWSMGLTPGLLLATNSLVYDTTAGGVYYKNDNAFKKFHFSTQTGFALRFGQDKKVQWSIGPDISLDMTRLMREDVFTKRRYLLFAGLTGRVFFFNSKK